MLISVEINGEEYRLRIHVLPRESLSQQALVGRDILQYADVHLYGDGVKLLKKHREPFLLNITIDRDECDDKNNFAHNEKPARKKELQEQNNDFKPKKTKTNDVERKITLKDERPIHQHPLRLSWPEKVEDENQEWLEEEIKKPSPRVLGKKKDGKTRICGDYRKFHKKEVIEQLGEERERLREEAKRGILKVQEERRKKAAKYKKRGFSCDKEDTTETGMQNQEEILGTLRNRKSKGK